jgi:hypothetical protein
MTKPEKFETTIRGCSRCNGKHKSLEFWRLGQAIEIRGERFDYWASCPETGEPVLLQYDVGTKAGDRG